MTMYDVKAFLPIDITDAMLVSSSIGEPSASEPAWNSIDTYAEFALVSKVTTNSHLVYESLQSANTNHALPTPPATSNDWWILKSYTNRWRMFEWNRGSASVGGSPLIQAIRPGKRISAIMLLGLKGSMLNITVQNGIGGPVVLNIEKNLLARHAMTPFEMAFTPFIYDTVFATFDVPPINDPVVTVTLTDQAGVCEIGRFGVGMSVDIGEVDWNTVREDENYSPITYEAGKAVFEPVPNWPGLEMLLHVDAKRTDRVLQFKDLANGKAVCWSAMPQVPTYEQMHMLIGPYQRFRFTTKNHKQAEINLKIRGI